MFILCFAAINPLVFPILCLLPLNVHKLFIIKALELTLLTQISNWKKVLSFLSISLFFFAFFEMLLSNMTSSVPIARRHQACIQRWNAVFWTPLYEVRWRAPPTDCLMQGNKLLKVAWVGVNDCLLLQQLLLTCQKLFINTFK